MAIRKGTAIPFRVQRFAGGMQGVDSPEHTRQHGIRQARKRVVCEVPHHERLHPRELPCRPDRSVDRANGPAYPLPFCGVQYRLGDLDVDPHGESSKGLWELLHGLFQIDEAGLKRLCPVGRSAVACPMNAQTHLP